jgi:hypothetical protein
VVVAVVQADPGLPCPGRRQADDVTSSKTDSEVGQVMVKAEPSPESRTSDTPATPSSGQTSACVSTVYTQAGVDADRLEELLHRADEIAAQRHSAEYREQLDTAFLHFAEYCTPLSIDPLRAPCEVILLYLGKLSEDGRHRFDVDLAAITDACVRAGLPDPIHNVDRPSRRAPEFQRLARGALRKSRTRSPRAPRRRQPRDVADIEEIAAMGRTAEASTEGRAGRRLPLRAPNTSALPPLGVGREAKEGAGE